MSDSLNYLLAGFFGRGSEILADRRKQADEYFADQYALAREYATVTRSQLAQDASSRKTDLARLKSLGVPNTVISRAMSDDPELVTTLADDLEQLAAKGVDITRPEIYSGLEQAAKEQGITTSQLIKESGDDIAANATADPYGFKADPIGAIRSTLAGFRASPIERAEKRLEQTMIGDRSATDWLSTGGVPENTNNDVSVGINWNEAGDTVRALEAERETDTGLTVPQRASLIEDFSAFKEDLIEQYRSARREEWFADGGRETIIAEAEAEARRRLNNVYGKENVDSVLGEPSSPPAAPSSPAVEPSSSLTGPLPQPKTKEEALALPSGTTFMAPDGTIHTRP